MTVYRQSVDAKIRNLLVEAQFDFEHPSPLLAWNVFQKFMLTEIPEYPTIAAAFKCEQDEAGEIVYLSFTRCLESDAVSFECGCAFSRAFPEQFRKNNDVNYWWWPQHSDYATWKREVENMPRFQICMKLDGWVWRGYSL